MRPAPLHLHSVHAFLVLTFCVHGMQYTWCQALLEVRGQTGIVALASCGGVAFGVAGLTMFVGMFSCCCCTIDTKPIKIEPKKEKVLNDARVHVCDAWLM
jgi:hypothetical protein